MYRIIQAIVLFMLTFVMRDFLMIKVITMDNFVGCVFFLITLLLTIILLFIKLFRDVFGKTKRRRFWILLITPLILHGVICYLCIHFGNQPIGLNSEGVSFLLLNKFFIRAKPIDILVQQALLIILVKKLYQYKVSLRNIIILFIVAFGSLHVLQIFRINLSIGLGFTFFAILGSFIFPYMILKVKNGYLYNIIIHLMVYDLAALGFRFLH